MSGITQATDDTAFEASSDSLANGIAKIKVIGIGGGGGNSVQHMVTQQANPNVDYIVVNTDVQALKSNTTKTKIQIGRDTTRGLGSGSNPDVGRKAAEESRKELKEKIGLADITFITAGMGGGTGTGASPVIANIVRKELGSLTVAIVTKPFTFEGKLQLKKAEEGIEKLRNEVDALIIIPNDKLITGFGHKVSLATAFCECNNVLLRAVKGLSTIITETGYMNVDFNDVKSVLTDSGTALIGMGYGQGENAIVQAIESAIHSPLLEDIEGCKSRGILTNVSVSPDFDTSALNDLGERISAYSSEDALVKIGLYYDSNVKSDEVYVTMLIAGIEKNPNQQAAKETTPAQQEETLSSIFGAPQQVEPNNAAQAKTQPQEQPNAAKKEDNPFMSDDDEALPFFLTQKAD